MPSAKKSNKTDSESVLLDRISEKKKLTTKFPAEYKGKRKIIYYSFHLLLSLIYIITRNITSIIGIYNWITDLSVHNSNISNG
jgi:hypothetical protein